MVLVGFGVIAVFQYAGVGHIFQIGTDFRFMSQAKGLHQQKMHTSSLMMTSMECHCRACVCSWVNISLNSSSVCEDGWIKIQWKKRKARLPWEADVYLCCLFVSCGIGMPGG